MIRIPCAPNPVDHRDGAQVISTGMRVPVEWPAGKTVPKSDKPLRVGVRFGPVSPECTRPEDIKLYAIYVTAQGIRS